MPSARSLVRASAALAAFVFAVVGTAVAQSPNAAPELGLGARFAVVLVVNLVLAGALVAFGPRYAARTVADLREDPGGAFVWGLAVGIGGPILLAIFAITIIGLVVAIPGAVAFAILGIVGSAVTVVWIGDLLVDGRGTVDGKTAAVGALALSVPESVPILGNLVSVVLGFFGLGVVSAGVYRSWRD